MTNAQASVQIALGAGVIVLSILFLVRGHRRKFHILLLIGFMGLIGGLMASDLIDFWMGLTLFVLWFVLAGVFYTKERKERKKS